MEPLAIRRGKTLGLRRTHLDADEAIRGHLIASADFGRVRHKRVHERPQPYDGVVAAVSGLERSRLVSKLLRHAGHSVVRWQACLGGQGVDQRSGRGET